MQSTSSPKTPESKYEAPFVSIVMPVRNEAGFIARSVGCALNQDYPGDRFEVIVADGRSTDDTWKIVESLQSAHPNLKLVANPGGIASTGLNVAIGAARGEIIVRVDGHCEIGADYVRRCVEHLQNGGVDGVGGPIETVGETTTAKAIAAAMSSTFGVGGSAFRTIRGRTIKGRTIRDLTMLADTAPFPAYTRAAIERAGPYDEELVRNQDDEYNYRLRKLGARILLAADVKSRYYSRNNFRKLISQYFQYGCWKVRVMQKHPWQMSPRQFIPPLFVASLICSAALALFTATGLAPAIAICCCYLMANLCASALTASAAGWRLLPLLPVAFVSLHISYGSGFLFGLIKFAGRWRRAP
jgi:glycosyltransferase involved in cell wall biosynthesis